MAKKKHFAREEDLPEQTATYRFKVKKGLHRESDGETSYFIGPKEAAGTIIESEHELDEMFPNKYIRLQNKKKSDEKAARPEDEEALTEAEAREAESTKSKSKSRSSDLDDEDEWEDATGEDSGNAEEDEEADEGGEGAEQASGEGFVPNESSGKKKKKKKRRKE